MTRAAWLGHWRPPWPLGRGRRWGDLPWALSALGQAWMLGGREGRWPIVDWEARLPFGPRPLGAIRGWEPRPPQDWIAQLRHGRPQADPRTPGPKEGPQLRWAWSQLLAGEAAPLLAFGTVHLDLETRLRWLALLGAEAPDGSLDLPPFLEGLIPADCRSLPQGWWSRLLGGMDATGRLLPEGLPPEGFQGLEGPALVDLVWAGPQAPPSGLPAHPLGPGRWMLDPALRAWGRGHGASPEGLARGQAPRASAPREALQRFLQGGVPTDLDGVWRQAIEADLAGRIPDPLPPPSGVPWMDHVRVRWGGPLPHPRPRGYPPEGCPAHPCADPFAWMALGRTAYLQGDPETARAQFGWAHAHFQRLGATLWQRRAAHNAAVCTLLAGDLEAHRQWVELTGPLPPEARDVDGLRAAIYLGTWEEARKGIQHLLDAHPSDPLPWELLGLLGFMAEDAGLMGEALLHLKHSTLFPLISQSLDPIPGFPPIPSDNAELRLLQALLAFRTGHGSGDDLFEALAGCPNRLLRLAAGLEVLRKRPEARTPARLLEMETLAARAGAESALTALSRLWPTPQAPEGPGDLCPEGLRRLVEALGATLWVVYGEPTPRLLGQGPPPPETLVQRVHREGPRAPVPVGGRVWLSHALTWEGARVGVVLLGLEPGTPLVLPPWLPLLAPWVARLGAQTALPEAVPGGALLTDGSEPMGSLLRELARVAPSRLPVLLLGPSGSGKELLARELHARSGRPGNWVPVNCSALAEGLLESELFGHVKGAFTGAVRDRAGALEQASRGTLFLDEVADLSPRLQGLLLRALQEGEIQRVGSDRLIRVDLRIVAATHKDLEGLVARQAFRTDLWYRLQGCVLRMPSLRDRQHELPALLPDLAAQVATESGLPPPRLAPGLGQALAHLPWPGNFRELRHALQRAMLRAGQAPLGPTHFPELAQAPTPATSWDTATRHFQQRLLLESLRSHGFRATDTARALGISRPALYATAKRLGVDLREVREGREP